MASCAPTGSLQSHSEDTTAVAFVLGFFPTIATGSVLKVAAVDISDFIGLLYVLQTGALTFGKPFKIPIKP